MSRLIGLLAAVALLLLASPLALAQESTPATANSDGSPLLVALGYPDLVVSSDGTTMTAPDSIAAGRYHLLLENSSDVKSLSVSLARVPDDMTYDEVQAQVANSDPNGPPPDVFYKLTLAGGATAGPGSIADSIIDLPSGDWGIHIDINNPDTDTSDAPLDQHLVVTGDMPALTDPADSINVDLVEMAFQMPDTLPAGPHIWKVSNKGAFVHFLSLQSYPEPLTAEQIQATLDSESGNGTPAAADTALLDVNKFVEIGGVPTFSPGQSTWIEVDLQPGQYEVFCFMVGPGDVGLHAALGMYKIFTVE